MKIHYLVLAHHNPEQFHELVSALGDSPIYAHIDAKVDAEPFQTLAVTFTTERIRVSWGGWSQVEAIIALIRHAMPYVAPEDYVVLLSGDSYPLRTPGAIRDFFAHNHGDQFINSVELPSVEMNKSISRLSKYYVEYNPRNGQRNLLPKLINKVSSPRNWQKALGPREAFTGSTWWALTGEAVQWILEDIKEDPAFVAFMKHTRFPDEHFFQIEIGVSPFASRRMPTVLWSDWSRDYGTKPITMDESHVAEMEQKRLVFDQDGYGIVHALYARKFADKALTDSIRQRIWPITVPV
ncbi:beta-1,6-N-acetylglucosaminyltransferase [Specibacter sp. NPDC057265]|uniref:beta-1,6-N-acetylglucosaminyltransferase n=1 Tax=Specibacter sp. NPDC057265 TaxID=3346075 RepID=UPI00363AD20D